MSETPTKPSVPREELPEFRARVKAYQFYCASCEESGTPPLCYASFVQVLQAYNAARANEYIELGSRALRGL